MSGRRLHLSLSVAERAEIVALSTATGAKLKDVLIEALSIAYGRAPIRLLPAEADGRQAVVRNDNGKIKRTLPLPPDEAKALYEKWLLQWAMSVTKRAAA